MSPGVNPKKPPSAHAMSCLNSTPCPAQSVNFTVRDKLLQFGYARLERRPSPYKTHKPGTLIDFLIATDAGIEALKRKA